MAPETICRMFAAEGKVQKVELPRVEFTVCGDPRAIQSLIERIGNGQPLNDWGACSNRVIEIPMDSNDWKRHKVTTENVNTFNWSPNVHMYI